MSTERKIGVVRKVTQCLTDGSFPALSATGRIPRSKLGRKTLSSPALSSASWGRHSFSGAELRNPYTVQRPVHRSTSSLSRLAVFERERDFFLSPVVENLLKGDEGRGDGGVRWRGKGGWVGGGRSFYMESNVINNFLPLRCFLSFRS